MPTSKYKKKKDLNSVLYKALKKSKSIKGQQERISTKGEKDPQLTPLEIRCL